MYPNFLEHLRLSMQKKKKKIADYGIKVEPISELGAFDKAYSCMSIFILLRDNTKFSHQLFSIPNSSKKKKILHVL